jgi:hypothetical protein
MISVHFFIILDFFTENMKENWYICGYFNLNFSEGGKKWWFKQVSDTLSCSYEFESHMKLHTGEKFLGCYLCSELFGFLCVTPFIPVLFVYAFTSITSNHVLCPDIEDCGYVVSRLRWLFWSIQTHERITPGQCMGLNPDIPQKPWLGDISKEEGNTL